MFAWSIQGHCFHISSLMYREMKNEEQDTTMIKGITDIP
jgi:hypothetical protein